jgi:hypothetical protein
MTHPSTLRLHQLRLGELAPAEEGILRGHVADCAVCTSRLGHQEATRAAFQRMPVPPALAPRVSLWERLGALRWMLGAIPVLAALFLVLRVHPPRDGLREKGSVPALEAWVLTNGSARPAYTDEAFRAGTRVQLKYDARGRRYVTFAGRDGLGVVEVYGTVLGDDDGLQDAPFALTLDDSPGDQQFFAVLSDMRPAAGEVEAFLAGTRRMPGAVVASIVLRKE